MNTSYRLWQDLLNGRTGRRSWACSSATTTTTFGNRQTSTSGGDINGWNQRTTSYTASALNEHSTITTPGYKDISGKGCPPMVMSCCLCPAVARWSPEAAEAFAAAARLASACRGYQVMLASVRASPVPRRHFARQENVTSERSLNP
jgi:hypothetical protein